MANRETPFPSYVCMSRTQRISVLAARIVLLSLGARGQQSPAPSHPFDLIHVSLDLTIDYSDLAFKGVVINAVVPVEGVDSITLHFGKNLDLDSCSVDHRQAVCTRDQDRLRVIPQGGFIHGRKTDILVRYSDHNHASNRGFHWVRPTWPEARHEGFWSSGGPGAARRGITDPDG